MSLSNNEIKNNNNNNNNEETNIDPIEEFYRHQQKQRELQNKLPIDEWINTFNLSSSSAPNILSSKSNSITTTNSSYACNNEEESGIDGTSGEIRLRNEIKSKLKEKLIDRLYHELLK